MRFPIHSRYTDHTRKTYKSNFKDFLYQLNIISKIGFEVTITMEVKNYPAFDEVIHPDKITPVIQNCQNWIRHIKENKVIKSDFEFKFFRINEGLTKSICAVCDEYNIAYIAEIRNDGSYQVHRSFKMIETNSERLTYQRRNRESKKIETIERYQCFDAWVKIEGMLKSMLFDCQRFKEILNPSVIKDAERKSLIKRCRSNRISIDFEKTNIGLAVKIAGKVFYRLSAANKFINALIEEKQNIVAPSYDIYMDKSLI